MTLPESYLPEADDRQQADLATEYEAWLSDAKAQQEYRAWLSQPQGRNHEPQ